MTATLHPVFDEPEPLAPDPERPAHCPITGLAQLQRDLLNKPCTPIWAMTDNCPDEEDMCEGCGDTACKARLKAPAPEIVVFPSLKEIWDLDARIRSATEEMHEAEREAAAPYADALELLQAKRERLFEEALFADVPPEVHPFGTLRIEVPSRLTPRTIDDTAFVRLFPEHLQRCASVKIKVTEAAKVLSEADLERVLLPQERVYGAPVLKLVEPPAPKVMPGAAPKRKKSEILRERCES